MSKKIAAEKIDISNKSLDKIVPGEKPRIVWDTRLTGFGLKVIPSGTLSFIVNYRALRFRPQVHHPAMLVEL